LLGHAGRKVALVTMLVAHPTTVPLGGSVGALYALAASASRSSAGIGRLAQSAVDTTT
jgi:hypothetical protein